MLRHPDRRVLPGALLVCATLAIPAAQQKPTFRTGVEIVSIDVNVVDRQARPVGDLKADDFVVTVDRKPRRIVSAQFIRYDVNLASVADRRPAGAPARPSGTVPAAPPRNVILVIDEDSIETLHGPSLKKAANAFLDRFGPNDRFAIATIPRLRREIVFTRERGEVRKALGEVITANQRYRPLLFRIGTSEALAFERGDSDALFKIKARECCLDSEAAAEQSFQSAAAARRTAVSGPVNPGCKRIRSQTCFVDIEMEVRQLLIETHLRSQRSLEALRDLGDAMRQLPGPKTMLFISGGLPSPERASGFWYSDIEKSFAQGQVTLYTLYVEQPEFGQARYVISPTAAEDLGVEREAVESVTSVTGGTWMEAIGTVDQYFDRVAAELSGAYLLGIEVEASDRDGRPHHVQVKVSRRDVEVRARKQYVIEGALPRTPDKRRAVTVATEPGPPRSDPEAVIAKLVRTPSDLVPLIRRCGDHVARDEEQSLAFSAVERTERTLSKPNDDRTWSVAQRRGTIGELLLVKRSWAPGWHMFRDVFEVDGKSTHPQDDRLRKLLLDSSEEFAVRARAMSQESARYELDVVGRETNPPTSTMLFLHPSLADRFVFLKLGEEQRRGTTVWRVAYAERRRPTLLQGPLGDLPAEGSLWIQPDEGRLVEGLIRLNAGEVQVTITVTYAPAGGEEDWWMPSQMTEVYAAPAFRLEIATTYSRFRRLDLSK